MNSRFEIGMNARRSRPRQVGRLALVLWLTACHTWRAEPLSPKSDFGSGTRIRVWRTDGNSVLLIGPRIAGDSVVGTWAGSATRVAIALRDVRSTESFRISPQRTAFAVVGVVAVGGLVVGFALAGLAGLALASSPQ